MTTATRSQKRLPSLRSEAERDALVAANIGWAYRAARTHHERLSSRVRKRYTLEDAESDAIFGMLRAAELFDERRGYRFTTYAAYWMRCKITDGVMNSEVIHVPRNVRFSGLPMPTVMNERADSLSILPARPKGHPADEARDVVRLCVSRLGGKDRKVAAMRLEGVRNQDIADKLGVTKQRAQQLTARAEQKLALALIDARRKGDV